MSYHVHIIETIVLPGQKPTMAVTWYSGRHDTYEQLRQAQSAQADEYGQQWPNALAIDVDGATRDFVSALALAGVKITRVGITELANGPAVARDEFNGYIAITPSQHGYAEGVAHAFRTGKTPAGVSIPAEYLGGPNQPGTGWTCRANEYSAAYGQGATAVVVAEAAAIIAAHIAKES